MSRNLQICVVLTNVFHEFPLQGLYCSDVQGREVNPRMNWKNLLYRQLYLEVGVDGSEIFMCSHFHKAFFRPSFRFYYRSQLFSFESTEIPHIPTEQSYFQRVHLIPFLRDWLVSSCFQQFSRCPCSKDWIVWAVLSDWFLVYTASVMGRYLKRIKSWQKSTRSHYLLTFHPWPALAFAGPLHVPLQLMNPAENCLLQALRAAGRVAAAPPPRQFLLSCHKIRPWSRVRWQCFIHPCARLVAALSHWC